MTDDVLISGERVLAVLPERPCPGDAVLVRGERIVAVGSRHDLRADGVTKHHRPGATLLPGFVNAHVHLIADASPDPFGAAQTDPPEVLLEAMAARAAIALDAGVTTVRDLGDRHGLAFTLRDEITAGTRSGPPLLAAGAPLTPPGGHCCSSAASSTVRTRSAGASASWPGRAPTSSRSHGTAPIVDCVTAGVSSIEHCGWRGGSRGWSRTASRSCSAPTPGCPASGSTASSARSRCTPSWASRTGGSSSSPRSTRRRASGSPERPAGSPPGSPPTLIAVDGDPLTDLQALRHPVLVMTRGRTN